MTVCVLGRGGWLLDYESCLVKRREDGSLGPYSEEQGTSVMASAEF